MEILFNIVFAVNRHKINPLKTLKMFNIRLPAPGLDLLFALLFVFCAPKILFAQTTNLPSALHYQKIMVKIQDTTVYVHLYNKTQKVNPKQDKYYYWYKNQQIKRTRGGYDGYLLDGKYTEFFPNMNLKVQGQFNKGLKSDTWINWRETGEYEAIYQWSKGIKNGPFKEYNEKGDLIREGNYRNNNLDGNVIQYMENGKTEKKNYRNGILQITTEPALVEDSTQLPARQKGNK